MYIALSVKGISGYEGNPDLLLIDEEDLRIALNDMQFAQKIAAENDRFDHIEMIFHSGHWVDASREIVLRVEEEDGALLIDGSDPSFQYVDVERPRLRTTPGFACFTGEHKPEYREAKYFQTRLLAEEMVEDLRLSMVEEKSDVENA
jgi:hypothetical protein